MIVNLSTFLGLYVMVPLAVLLALWLCDRRRERQRPFTLAKRRLVRCDICLYTYYVESDATFAKCPQCGSMNILEERTPHGE